MADDLKKEDKPVFGVNVAVDGMTNIIVGIPEGAWDYMRAGKTCHFSLDKVGIPVNIIMFGAPTGEAAKAEIRKHNDRQGNTMHDLTDKQDFSVKDGGHSLKDLKNSVF